MNVRPSDSTSGSFANSGPSARRIRQSTRLIIPPYSCSVMGGMLLRFSSHDLVHLPVYYACGVLAPELGGFHQMPKPGFVTKMQLWLYPFLFVKLV